MTTIYASAKALSNLPKRRDFDFYPTPLYVAQDALSFLPSAFTPQCILDPGAGTGVWGKAARQVWKDTTITGIEIRPEATRPTAYNFWIAQDFLLTLPDTVFDLVIGNPPYNRAEQFIRHALAMLESGGYMIMMLRLAFLESKTRVRSLYRYHPPQTVVVRANRVSFTGDGQSNATPYAYFIWQKGWHGEPTLKWSMGV